MDLEPTPDLTKWGSTLSNEEMAKMVADAKAKAEAKRAVDATDKPPRHKPGEPFLRGPIPMDWLWAAGNLPGSVLQVAIALWWLASLKKFKTRVVKWRPTAGERFGLTRQSVYRGLTALGAAGLIRVERRRGRSPVITLLPVKGDDDAKA